MHLSNCSDMQAYTGWKIKDNLRKNSTQDNMKEHLEGDQDKSRRKVFRIYWEEEEDWNDQIQAKDQKRGKVLWKTSTSLNRKELVTKWRM